MKTKKKDHKSGKSLSPVKVRAINTETGDWFDYESISKAAKDLIIHSGSIYMLFTGREVRMGKNGARGLEYGQRPQAEGRTQDQGHSFFPYGPT